MNIKGFDINPAVTAKKLIKFISITARSKGFDKVLLGLSGGLDSSVVAFLAAAALGKDNVIGVIMPYGKLSPEASNHAEKIAKILKIKKESIDIKPSVDVYFRKVKTSDIVRRGNKMARERMSVLYDLSRKHNGLVIGTSNRTEILLGYGTIHGDCACAMNPLGRLYKTQLKTLAAHLGVPSYIIDKPPSAGLWAGQEDEKEIGYQYSEIDRLLFFMIDKKANYKKLVAAGFEKQFIKEMQSRIRKNKFKSQLPVIAKL